MKGTTARVTLVAALALGVLAAIAAYTAGRVLGEDPGPAYKGQTYISIDDLPTATFPASIQGYYRPFSVEVEGNDVRLPSELIYQTVDSAAADGSPTSLQRITYPVPPDIGPSSWIDLSEDGHIIATSIQPGHQPYFEPLLAAATSPATPAPVPTVLINGVVIEVPPWLLYSKVPRGQPGGGLLVLLAYAEDGRISRLYLDEGGNLVRQEILAGHEDKFASVLAALPDSVGE
jgi:hypothetical protein